MFSRDDLEDAGSLGSLSRFAHAELHGGHEVRIFVRTLQTRQQNQQFWLMTSWRRPGRTKQDAMFHHVAGEQSEKLLFAERTGPNVHCELFGR